MNKNADQIGDVNKQADKAKTTDNAPVKKNDVEPPQKPNDVDKQKKIEELKAKRAEAEAQKKLQEGIKEAEAKGKIKKLPEADRKWLESDPRHKELAYDPDQKNFKIDEAKAALKAEQDGVLKPPVRRAINKYGGGGGDDFVDGAGKFWDVKKGIDAKGNLTSDKILESLKSGESVLVDTKGMTQAEIQKLKGTILTQLPNADIKFIQ